MKKLNTLFNFLLFPLIYFNFSKQKLRAFAFALFLSFTLLPLSLHADDNCTNTEYIVSLSNSTPLYENSGTVTHANQDSGITDDSYYVSIDTPGKVTITLINNSVDGDVVVSYGENACPERLNGALTYTLLLAEAADFNLLVYPNSGGQNVDYDYNLTISYTPSTSPEVSISPSAVNVPVGIASTDLQVTLDVAPNMGDLNITYTNSYDNSTGYFIIDQWYTNHTLTVDTSNMIQGTEFNITLTGATGVGAQDDGVISDEHNFSTISIVAPDADLYITKTDSIDPVKVNTNFDYIIKVTNAGTADATNINVTDTLPAGLTINLGTSNTASVGWNCIRSGDLLTCIYDSNLSAGSTATIWLHTTAPSSTGTITNSASVSSDSDFDLTNNSTTETTWIVDENFEGINEALELCYTDTTTTAGGNSCETVGNFKYGYGCTATVNITVKADLTDINITKMYAPEINTDPISICDSIPGTCTGPKSINIEEAPSYTMGYEFDIGTVSSDNNITITDKNSYDGNPHNPADLDAIAIYATYIYNGAHHFGRVYSCSGANESGIEVDSAADAIDPIINTLELANYYNQTSDNSYSNTPADTRKKYIQTMVATATRNITGVYLDVDTRYTEPYEQPVVRDNQNNLVDSPFVIVPYLVDNLNGQCDEYVETIYGPDGNELVIEVADGAYSRTVSMLVPDDLRRDARLQLITVDPNTLSEEGQQCLATSSTSGNLARISQCANAEEHYVPAFGVDAWDRCGMNNGKPCTPEHGGYSGGGDPSYPGYNPLYDTELGCYMCTFNIQPSCSTDNFAIRPDRFDASITYEDAPYNIHEDYPNLLRSGQNYYTSLTAKNYNNSIPADYTVSNFHNIINSPRFPHPDPKKYFNGNDVDPWIEDLEGLLKGDTPDPIAVNPSHMVNGLSSLTTTTPTSAQPIVGITFTDVGRVSIYVADMNWSYVDRDDTVEDCNNSHAHTFICAELNATFIPHHFGVNNIHLRDHRDGDFTYLSNDLNMSAHLNVNISAVNANNAITQNFRKGALYYENPVSVELNVTEWNTTTPSTRHPKGNSVRQHDIPTETLLGFGGLDANGTHLIPWNETNATQQLMFNYTRQNNQTVNPFEINGTDINISVQSTYTDGITPSSPAIIMGGGIGDRNATFFFARAKTAETDDFYEGVTDSSIITPATILVYCDKWPASAANCPAIDTVNGLTNNNYWWLSTGHDMATGNDGNITLTVGTANGSLNNTVVSIDDPDNGVDESIIVTNTIAPLPTIVDIHLNTGTNSWLIYNPVSDVSNPIPFYRVEFIGESDWTGHGKTGHVVDSNASKKRNNRIGW